MAASVATRRSKRRRLTGRRLHLSDVMDTHEERLLNIALSNSMVEKQRKEHTVPTAKIFHPTFEEFRDPIKYIQKIRDEGSKTGICKIVPPKGWNPSIAVDLHNNTRLFETRLQHINRLQEGKYYDEGRKHTFETYRNHADEFRKKWFEKKGWKEDVSSNKIAQEYWKLVETGQEEVQVEYANDLDTTKFGSGFKTNGSVQDTLDEDGLNSLNFADPEYYTKCGWNLHNLPRFPGSVLRHIRTPINGVNVPWLYCGMLFATFCWHTEDNYLYSINYMHTGAKKRWYGVPSSKANAFEKVMKKNVPLRFREDPNLLFHLVTMVSPSTLLSNRVNVYTLVQEPGDIILTFPQSYHAGFSEGFNCNEAVNFALPDWIDFGRNCVERYRRFARLSVFSHDRLMCTLSKNLQEQTNTSCLMLLKEMRRLYDEEIELRRQIYADGIRNVIQMPQDKGDFDDATMKDDDRRQCYACKHSCYFSGIICPCSESMVSCLRHSRNFCRCDVSQKCLLLWSNISILLGLMDKIKEQLRYLDVSTKFFD